MTTCPAWCARSSGLHRGLGVDALACGLALLATTIGRGVAVTEPIGLVARLNDVAVMRETIE